MLKGIEFHNSSNREYQFETKDDYNLMNELTSNTIILCANSKIKNFIMQQIVDILDCKHKEFDEESHDYNTDDYPCNMDYKYIIQYLPTTILSINSLQQIILTIEAPFILQAQSPKDIWFVDYDKDNKLLVYPFTIFKGYKDDWDEGVMELYKNVCNGRYGCYVGYKL